MQTLRRCWWSVCNWCREGVSTKIYRLYLQNGRQEVEQCHAILFTGRRGRWDRTTSVVDGRRSAIDKLGWHISV